MKILLLCVNLLICFGILLEEVRKEVVDKALLNLPKRESIDILKMALAMSSAKEDYSMTDVESAYFAYKWISQNIELDCLGKESGHSSTLPTTTYKDGKGGEIGITELFNMICGFLNIESNTILGVKKDYSDSYTTDDDLFITFEYAWNYISIDNKYYLLDVISGSGLCGYDSKFHKIPKDEYFGMEPEFFIRYLFPNNKEWQLLSKTITEEQFKSQAILDYGFFKYFNNISPDVETIKEQTKVKFSFKDSKIEKLYFKDCYSIEKGTTLVPEGQLIKNINGTCEVSIRASKRGYVFLEVSEDNKNYYKVVTYGVNIP